MSDDNDPPKPLLRCLDISGIFHPIWRVKESKGDPVGQAAVETIQALRERAAPGDATYVVACCDAGRCFRHAIGKEWQAVSPDYKGYKGHRADKDPAMIAALERVTTELAADGIPILRAPDFEADDVIATLATWAGEQGYEVEIVTDDKDLFSLVGPGVHVVRRDGSLVGPEEVFAKFGVEPPRLLEYLAIVGDASDHVPGVKGMGPEAAKGILRKHGGYLAAVTKARNEDMRLANAGPDDIYEPLFKPAQRVKLIEGERAFRVSLRMTTLCADVPLDFAAVTAPRVPTERPNKTPWQKPIPADVTAPETEYVIDEEEPMSTENHDPRPPTDERLPPIPEDVGEPVAPPQQTAAIQPTGNRQIVRLSPEQFKLALEPQNYEMARTVAEDMYDSGLFAVQRVQAALAIIQVGRAHGLSAVTSLMEIHMIEGKPQMSAKLMVALVRKSGKADYFKLVEASPLGAKWKTHRRDDPDPDPVFGSFTIDEARRALLGGIASKDRGVITVGEDFKPDSQYAKYPEDMCVWRAAVRLIRREYSDVTGGLYATEEMSETEPTSDHRAAA